MDPRGTITKYVQSDGTTVFAAREYDAFGTIIPNSLTGTWPGVFGYQGQAWQEIQSANGSQRLLLSPAWLYDPADGRFLSRDPLRMQDAKKRPSRIQPFYLYVVNNPLVYVDVEGRTKLIAGGTPTPSAAPGGWQALSTLSGFGEDLYDPNAPLGGANVRTVITNPASTMFVYQPVFSSLQGGRWVWKWIRAD
jgi:RHS repeat-associated protein